MRFLSKIAFINSAAIKYAEINLDGNVHFIGTQGVGKSTILRAILFFYSANQRKLGVPTGPTNKIFSEWYFPYINSYIVYEIQKETNAHCVLAFKSQNRVCFRFMDGAFDRKYFMGKEGNVFDSWEKSRALLDADRRDYSYKVNNYADYKDILYGNFEGKSKLKKYALLESKQYKNIPRTIQNVFLNSKLEADFIKQTIIRSMNEEEDITIDLQKYSHHLENFEVQLTDIKNFHAPSVQESGYSAAKLYPAIKHLEKEIVHHAYYLGWALDHDHKKEPQLLKELQSEQAEYQSIEEKIQKERSLFQKREKRFLEEISVLNNKLKEAKTKKDEYDSINITDILGRVFAKNNLEIKKQVLEKEKGILSAQFTEITQKYDAISMELKNGIDKIQNKKDREKIRIEKNFQCKKASITAEYETLIAEIRRVHKNEVDAAKKEFETLQQNVFDLKSQKIRIKLKRFYEEEINSRTIKLNTVTNTIEKSAKDIENFRKQMENFQIKWELEKKQLEVNCEQQKGKNREKIEDLQKKAKSVAHKIDNSKKSLFGWLNEKYPSWRDTIGKVCQEDILFQNELSPKFVPESKKHFYGVEINLQKIDRTSKTIADYEYEQTKLNEEIEQLKQDRRKLIDQFEKDLDRIEKRNRPKIRIIKDSKRAAEYEGSQASTQKQQLNVELNDVIEKAATEKQQAISSINERIGKAQESEIKAKEKINNIEAQLERRIITKQRERDHKIRELQTDSQAIINRINGEIASEKMAFEKRNQEVSKQKKQELYDKGADTVRLSDIENKLLKINAELTFIEDNRDKVAEYNLDKRELFDRVGEFKNNKQLIENKLKQETERHKQVDNTLERNLGRQSHQIGSINRKLSEIKEDLEEFSRFKLSEVYQSIEQFLTTVDENYNTKHRTRTHIEKIKDTFYSKTRRENELKETIDKFLGNFSEQNIFNFKAKLITLDEYLNFSQELIDFIEEDKISEYEKRVNERFASIITSIGKETTDLISRTGDIQKIVRKINADFSAKNFVGAIKKIELRVDESANKVVVVLKLIKEFNDSHTWDFGEANLFTTQDRDANNKTAIDLLKQLVKEIDASRRDSVSLSDSFELKFRIEENQNDTDWVEKLSNVGSDGTDVLVKAMVNIMLLNVFKEGASKRFKDFRLHCMMDEIGKLHPTNVKGILKFANDRNIFLINGSPTTNTPASYKHIYKVEKDTRSITKVKRILSTVA